MSHKILEGKKGIIFGALDELSIAWKTAEAIKQAGGEFILTNAPVALRMGKIDELGKNTNSKIFAADATNLDDLNKLVEFTLNHFDSKLDFILHSIGMSINVRKGKHYTDLNYDYSILYGYESNDSFISYKRHRLNHGDFGEGVSWDSNQNFIFLQKNKMVITRHRSGLQTSELDPGTDFFLCRIRCSGQR